MTKLTGRGTKALNILKAGGYFRKALERNYHGGETFETRLRDANGHVVKGIGVATFFELSDADLLEWRETAPSSTYPTEHILKA